MNYCPECGTKLIKKQDGNEGMVDYCEKCGKFHYPTFNSAISTIVIKDDQVLLIKQYGRDSYILVAGYISKGENAKETLIREVKEETNLEVVDYLYNDNFYFSRSNTLMHNYISYVRGEVQLTNEVDEATYFSYHDAYVNIRHSSLAKKFLFYGLLKLGKLKDLLTFTDTGIELYDFNEQLVLQYTPNVRYFKSEYVYLKNIIRQIFEECYN